jgi:lysophospholipase L1-like esterase
MLLACNADDNPNTPSPAPGPPPADQAIHYTAVGASDALGIGGSVECIPLTACPNGTGYVPIIARRLATGRTVTLTNLGIPAAVIGPSFQSLGLQHGRTIPGNFLERAMPFVPRSSNVVTIFAGGNDTNVVGTAIQNGAGGSDLAGYIGSQVRTFGNDYDALVRGIRERAPSARIVVANLPNMAGLPYAARYTLQQRQVLQQIAVGFTTTAINRLTAQGVAVVDLMCDPRAYEAGRYSSDGFHPNDAGYAFLADEMSAAITSAGYPEPRPSCPQMTLVGPQ